MKIGTKLIGKDQPCYIVAEIGINHNGSVGVAKQLIDVAHAAGCNAVKFQKRTVDVVYTKEELDKPRESPFGTTNRELKRGLEFGTDEYEVIDSFCRFRSMRWFASPWDVGSAHFLEKFDVPAYKIASACVTDESLLSVVGKFNKPVIMSTGMSEVPEIDLALVSLENCDVALLACTSTYPAKIEELNLNRIATLKQLYPWCEVGYSGHEVGIWTTLCAVAMGASIVERHITLDRSMWGSDQSASLEPSALIKLVREIRDFESARGNGELRRLMSETAVWEKLRRYK